MSSSSSSSSASAQEEAGYGSSTPKDIKGKTSILRLLNSEEKDETRTAAAAESLLLLQQQSEPARLAQEAHDDAEVVAAARILLALATEDGAEVTDNEGEVFPVDEGAFASASNAPINLPVATTISTSTGPAEVLDHQRVVDLCRRGHYATGRPFRLMNPEAPKGVPKIYHAVPMSEVHRLNIPTKDFVYLNHKKGNGENVAAAAAAKPAAVPPTSSFTAINRPPAADAQRPEAKPKVEKPAAKQPARKPAKKPVKKAAKKEASAPVAPTPQEKPEVVKKTSSGRAVKKPKLYES
ncbi:MAG: hypothetical protein L6R35_005546 [Caloplaca aegaea]|nr:MAG: hypothetical protein L6R35_005546 [Caloplaca aegaea]